MVIEVPIHVISWKVPSTLLALRIETESIGLYEVVSPPGGVYLRALTITLSPVQVRSSKLSTFIVLGVDVVVPLDLNSPEGKNPPSTLPATDPSLSIIASTYVDPFFPESPSPPVAPPNLNSKLLSFWATESIAFAPVIRLVSAFLPPDVASVKNCVPPLVVLL